MHGNYGKERMRRRRETARQPRNRAKAFTVKGNTFKMNNKDLIFKN